MTPQQPKRVSLRLTEEQRKKIREATGQDAEFLDLTAEELEARIVPSAMLPDTVTLR